MAVPAVGADYGTSGGIGNNGEGFVGLEDGVVGGLNGEGFGGFPSGEGEGAVCGGEVAG